jgi:cytosine/adenosine deaminase-related metal-dependent hydrolase
VSLTDEGRETAELVEYCYVEMSYGGEYETREQCQAVAKSQGLEMIGAGVGRDIFAIDEELHTGDVECILKVPKNLVGAFECRREIQTWRDVEELRPFLTPVLDHGMG